MLIKKFIVISYNLKHKNLLVITGKGKDNSGVLKKIICLIIQMMI